MNLKFQLFCVTTFLVQSSWCTNLETLKMVQVVYRHGERAPVEVGIIPSDPNNKDFNKNWPNGIGQLTSRGIAQQFDLGIYLRQRYDGLMDMRYRKGEIYVLSSDDDRALMSAQANLAGLYPKLSTMSDSGNLAGKIDMQLVPIHTLAREIDKELKMRAPCPRKEAAVEEVNSSEEIQKFLDENLDFMEFIIEKGGYGDMFKGKLPKMALLNLMSIVDTFQTERDYNLTIPDWATSEVIEKMNHIRVVKVRMRQSATAELRRFFGGPLVKRLMSNMLAEANQPGSQPKMFMFSGHDESMIALMNTMGVFNNVWPPCAAMIIVELHEMKPMCKLYVEIFYRNTTEQEPYRLQLPDCGNPCYLEEMNNVLSPFLPDNWEAECQLAVVPNLPRTTYQLTYLIYFFIVVFITIIIWSVVMCVTSKRGYKRLNNKDFLQYGSRSMLPLVTPSDLKFADFEKK